MYDDEYHKLFEREYDNYKNLKHPFIPNFYGIIYNKNYKGLAIEYINGQTLDNIEVSELKYDEKIRIIFEMMIIIEFLHRKHFIYRDLKPNNIMLDSNKNIILIDFDLMIKHESNFEEEEHTRDFATVFVAPEVNTGTFSYECDIYSIGKMIYYIMNEKIEEITIQDSYIKGICEKCTRETPEERPKITELLFDFYSKYHSTLKTDKLRDIYDINKIRTIKKFTETTNSQNIYYTLGLLYYENKLVQQNLPKSIHYLSLSSDQNYSDAQYLLGKIYYEGQYISQDINKSIHYLTLSSNQNNSESQYLLGKIYYEGKFVPQNIDESIKYFTQASEQNNSIAQFNLGIIYLNTEYNKQDIKKAYHYLKQAALQNHVESQFQLGVLYSKTDFIKHNIFQSLHYLSHAAQNNHPEAQFYLGSIYYENPIITRDISRAIHFFELASQQNHSESQFTLGVIYYEGRFVQQDINKSLHYFSLAAKHNHQKSILNIQIIQSNRQYF